jgi:tyrosine-specific transport protein
MNSKLLGGILLVVGTAIGGGMLALPVATSATGFFNSTLLLFVCWLIMTASAFLILEVNLWLPANSNIISMAKATLGAPGQVVAWLSYLLLLYSLLAAYIAGGGDFLGHLIAIDGMTLPNWVASLLFAVILGFIVYCGIRSVDYVNRALMITKFGALALLLILILPHVSSNHLAGGQFKYITASVTVAITSFGFSNIIPSLRAYFHSDVKKLRLAILIGSLIPLVCYILWDLAIMGVISRDGADGLIAMAHSGHSNSEFVSALSVLLQRETITVFARIFTSICLATSFLGVALSLSDFLADGLRVAKSGKGNLIIFTTTFLPPMVIVLFYPGAFIAALSYAGIYCMILLVLLPALMAWSGRYRKQLPSAYRVWGGKPLLIALMISAILIIGNSFFN